MKRHFQKPAIWGLDRSGHQPAGVPSVFGTSDTESLGYDLDGERFSPVAARWRRQLTDVVLTAAPLVVVSISVCFLVWAFLNHRSALILSLHSFDLSQNVRVLGPQGQPLSQEAANELLARIESARKGFFDSNTITFLWSLFLVLAVNVGAYLYSQALRSLKEMNVHAADIARKARALAPLLEADAASDAIAMLYGQAQLLLAFLPTKPQRAAPVLRDTFAAIEKRLRAVKKSRLGLERWAYEYLILDVAHRIDSSLQRSRGQAGVDDDMLERSRRCLALVRCLDLVRRYETLLADVDHLAASGELPSRGTC